MINIVSSDLNALHAAVASERRLFSVRRVPFAASDTWSLRSGALRHLSNGFFNIVGARQSGQADRIFIYQPQAAVTGLITTIEAGERFFLLQARAEPGNPGGIQFGPTVQATAANYLRLHGGEPTPYIEAFLTHDRRIRVLADTTQTDHGERYLYKTKRAVVLEVDEMADPAPSFHWVSSGTLSKAIGLGLFLNPDLRTLLGLCPWTISPDAGELHPASGAVRESLAAPLRADRLGAVLAQPPNHQPPLHFVPTQALVGWSVDHDVIKEVLPHQGISVAMYDTAVGEREVKAWTQPLIEANSKGHAVMMYRHSDGGLEVFARFARETGLGSLVGLGTSFTRYPGQRTESPTWLEAGGLRVVREVEESDEGGRFYQNVWTLQFAYFEDGLGAGSDKDGVWLRLSELKALLHTSNICTIQLRVMLLHLLVAPLD